MTLATAVILAIAAAFAAPLYVDWSQWRSSFEEQMSRAVGAPVALRGRIDAEILPTPRVVLRDVVIGRDPARSTATIGELRGTLSLGALIRGEINIEHIRLAEPRVRLVLGADGAVTSPGGAAQPAGFSISELGVENGTLVVVEPAGVVLSLGDVDLNGEVTSIAGPMKFEGEVATGNQRQSVRLALGAFSGGVSRARLVVQGITSPLSLSAEGALAVAAGRPSFEGRATLGMKPGADASSPLARAGWNLAANIRAQRSGVEASELALTLGNAERPVELNGNGRLAFAGPGGAARLDLALAARQLDLNNVAAGGSPLAVVLEVGNTLNPLAHFAPSGTVALSGDTVLLGGAQMRELRADLGWSGGSWQVRALQAKLPGRSTMKVSGRMGAAPVNNASGTPPGGTPDVFSGTLAFETEDVPAFASWALPGSVALVSSLPAGAATLSGTVSAGSERLALEGAKLVLTPTSGPPLALGGALSLTTPADASPRIVARLSADGADLDALLAPMRRLVAMGGQASDVVLALTGSDVRLSGLPANRIDVALRHGPGDGTARDGLTIERLVLNGFGGLDINASGRLADASASSDGHFEARLTGGGTEGVAALVRLLRPEGADSWVQRLAPSLAPLDLTLTLDSSPARSSLTLHGSAGPLAGTAALQYGGGASPTGSTELDIADGSAVLKQLGVPGLRAGLGPARLLVRLTPDLDAELMLAGAHLAARGDPGLDAEGTVQPNLQIEAQASDLGRLFPAVADAADSTAPVALAMTGAVSRSGDAGGAFRLARLSGLLAGVRLEGSALYGGDRPGVEADLRLERWSLGRALGLVAGRTLAGPGVPWTEARFGAPALVGLPATVSLAIGTFDLPDGRTLGDARVRARLADGQATVEELSGALAGGRLAASGKLRRRGDLVDVEGHVNLANADLGQLLGPLVATPAVKGRLSLGLDLAGRGRSPVALAQTLAGQGSLSIDGFEIAGIDPSAVRATMLAYDKLPPSDAASIAASLQQAIGKGTLRIGRLDVPVSVLNGLARSGTARLTQNGQRLTLDASLDIVRLGFDGTLEIDDASDPAATAPPGVVVGWRGPLAAPERRLDIMPLTAAINMRTLERETKRLEQEYSRNPRPPAPTGAVPANAAQAGMEAPPASPAAAPRGAAPPAPGPEVMQPAPLGTVPAPQLAPPLVLPPPTPPAASSGSSDAPYVPPFLMQPAPVAPPSP
nr:AsmA family protein [Ancylobacter crimeensis]